MNIIFGTLLFVCVSVTSAFTALGQDILGTSLSDFPVLEDKGYFFWGINTDSTAHYTDLMRKDATSNLKNDSVSFFISLGFSCLFEDRYDSANAYFGKAMSFGHMNNLEKALILEGSGQSEIFNGDIESGIIKIIEARRIFNEAGNIKEAAQCDLILALACFDMGQYQLSISLLLRLAPYFAIKSDYNNLVLCLNGLGRVYAEQNKTDAAFSLYQKALEICSEKEVLMTPSISLNNIGMLYYMNNSNDSALGYFRAAIVTDERCGNYPLLPGRYNNIGNVLLKLGNPLKAEEYYTKGLDVLAKYPDPYSECQIINNLADARLAQKKYKEAEKLYLSSLTTARALNLQPLVYYNCESLSKLYEKTGEDLKELTFLKEYYQLRDSLNNEEHLHTLDELEVRYKTESQKHVIDKLEQQNELNDTRIQRDKNLRWIYFLLIFFLSTLIVLFYYFLRIRQRLNKALLTENRNLNEVNEFKDRFFNLISHEFRTPLSLIMGPAQEISNDITATHAQKEKAALIKMQAEKLLGQVIELLDLARAGKGMLDLQIEQLSLSAFVQDISNPFFELAADKHISLTVNDISSDILCWMDGNKMEKVISNLLSNAVKFTPEGGLVELNVSIVSDENSGLPFSNSDGWIRFSVSDNGPGIATGFHDKIFDRFYRCNDEKTARLPGSGIGLSVVKEFTELHKGFVKLFSEPGRGSIFSVYIPAGSNWFDKKLLRSSGRTLFRNIPEPKSISSSPEENSDPGLGNGSILIVEDDNELRKFLVRFFKPDFKTFSAPDGKRGLELARREFPDMIISDIQMPEMDGIEMCEALKSDVETSHIPVILLTARVDDKSLIAGLKAGADDYIRKPFDIEELELRVNNIVARTRLLHEKFAASPLTPATGLQSVDQRFMEKLLKCCEAHYSNPGFDADLFTDELNVSLSTLHRKMKTICGTTPREFLKNYRLQKAFDMISAQSGSVSEIAFLCGFENLSYFARIFKEKFDSLPSEIISK